MFGGMGHEGGTKSLAPADYSKIGSARTRLARDEDILLLGACVGIWCDEGEAEP